MKQYEITGLGPTQPDGSFKMFTRLPAAFLATAAWVAEQSIPPAVGDVLEVSDAGALTLVSETQAGEDADAELPKSAQADFGTSPIAAVLATEKKSLGSAESETSSSAFREYQAKPVIVRAAEITDVGELNSDGSRYVDFADGSSDVATPEMLARITPVVGDYWVIASQDNGDYVYLNPKAVFEAKYQLVAE